MQNCCVRAIMEGLETCSRYMIFSELTNCRAVAARSVLFSPDWVLPSHRRLRQYHCPAQPHCVSWYPQLHTDAAELRRPGSDTLPI